MSDSPSIGIFAKTLDPAFIEVAGRSGLDFVIIDMEHGPLDLARVHDHVRALALTPARSFIRVPRLDAATIGSALDSGADGVLVPNIKNAEQARAAVQAARFHPEGGRGVCRYVRAAGFGETPGADYFEAANRATLVCQIEGREAVDQLDEILDVEGIDILFIGPYDLSQSLGCPGEVGSSQVLEFVAEIATRAKKHGVRTGAFSDDPKLTQTLLECGVSMMACSVDVEIFRSGLDKLLADHSHG